MRDIIARVEVRWIKPDAFIGARRGEAVVCVTGVEEHLAETMLHVVAHTTSGVRVLVCAKPGAGGPATELQRQLGDSDRTIWFAGEIELAIEAAAPADVVLLRSGSVVAAEWLDQLRKAAYVDARVASATALTDHGPGITVGAIPAPLTFDQAAAAIGAGALRNRPRLQVAGRHCVYVRRTALELAGGLDRGTTLDDFSRRCLHTGLCHVLADDVLVASHGEQGPAARSSPRSIGPLARSLGAARRSLNGLSVVIDARILGGPMNGTKVHVLELLAAVVRSGNAHVTALVPASLDASTRELVRSTGASLTTVEAQAASPESLHADIVHRPYQLSDPADLALLTQLADRLVVTQLDLIGYHNPSYFPSPREWEGYRRLIRTALGIADRVVFLSAHARDDALAEDLIEPARASVVPHGVDHALVHAGRGNAIAPAGTDRLPRDAEMILCLGTDYRHKNRVFALRLLDELRRRHDWQGWLVMAGASMKFGSSVADENELLALRPPLGDAVLRLGAVSEDEKEWLLGHATLVAYPTVQEGFGLVPFEAAEHGVPCLWAPGTAIGEVISDAAGAIVPWDPGASADRALELMRDQQAAARNVEAIRLASKELRWEQAAARLIEVYQSTCDEPQAPASELGRAEGLTHSGLSEDAIRLVGPAGALPRDLERPLLALATHPKLAIPVFRVIRAGYRVSHRWRPSGPGRNGTHRD